MASNRFCVGVDTIKLARVDSTNRYANDLLKSGSPEEGTVIIAREQYSGKGQGGNKWESAPGQNITLSIVFYPSFLPASKQFLLNEAISLGVLHFFDDVLEAEDALRIKWPNDLLYEDNKIGGLLLELQVAGQYLKSAVAGIGLNINQTAFQEAPEATSLKQITGRSYSIPQLLPPLYNYLDQFYKILRSGEYDRLQHLYHQHLYRYQEYHSYQLMTSSGVSKEKIRAQLLGVSEEGRLILEQQGDLRKVTHKEVTFC